MPKSSVASPRVSVSFLRIAGDLTLLWQPRCTHRTESWVLSISQQSWTVPALRMKQNGTSCSPLRRGQNSTERRRQKGSGRHCCLRAAHGTKAKWAPWSQEQEAMVWFSSLQAYASTVFSLFLFPSSSPGKYIYIGVCIYLYVLTQGEGRRENQPICSP